MINPTPTYSQSRTLDIVLLQTMPRLLYFIPHLVFCKLILWRLFRLLSPYLYDSLELQFKKILEYNSTAQPDSQYELVNNGDGDDIFNSPSTHSVGLVGRQGGAFRRTSTSKPISYFPNSSGYSKPAGQPAGGGRAGQYTVEDKLEKGDRKNSRPSRCASSCHSSYHLLRFQRHMCMTSWGCTLTPQSAITNKNVVISSVS